MCFDHLFQLIETLKIILNDEQNKGDGTMIVCI